MENKIFITLAFLFLSIAFFIVTVSADEKTCTPKFALANQDPVPAIPNSYVKIVIEASNLQNCDGISLKLIPKYPFSLDAGAEDTFSLQSRPYGIGYKDTWTIPLKIRVAEDSLEGDYDIELLYKEGMTPNFENYSIKNYFNISISDVQTDFAVVVQDSSGSQVSLGIVNTGKNTANSLIIGIPSQDNFIVSGTTQQIVGNLASGDYTIVNFNIASRFQRNFNRTSGNNPNNPAGQNTPTFNASSNTLKVKLEYTDGIGERRSVIKEISYNPMSSGNFSSATRFNQNRNTNSQNSIWTYIEIGAGIIILIIIVIFIFKKYKEKIKNLFNKNKKNSSKTPDWITSEKSHHNK